VGDLLSKGSFSSWVGGWMDGTETEGRRRSEIRLLLPRLLLMCLNFFFFVPSDWELESGGGGGVCG